MLQGPDHADNRTAVALSSRTHPGYWTREECVPEPLHFEEGVGC